MSELSKSEWMAILQKQDEWNRRHLFSVFQLFGVPDKMLDVGSGTGAMVKLARMNGSEAYGVDLLQHSEDFLFCHDLRTPFSLAERNLPSQVALVLSIEVGEHIEKAKHDVYCDTVANHVMAGGMLIFTSAFPGQSGEEHVGIEMPYYWRNKFGDRGLTFRPEPTQALQLLWSNIKSPLMWLSANVQVLRR